MNRDNLTATDAPAFMQGLDLCELFFKDAVAPIIEKDFAGLAFSAALIGSGSEILGFDNLLSSDHHWGPRVMLFLKAEDFAAVGTRLKEHLSLTLPRKFRGYSTGFTQPNPEDNGTQLLADTDSGPINHRVEVLTINEFFQSYLGFDIADELTNVDWLTFPEQKLRTVVSGRVFHDEIGLQNVRDRFQYYPQNVWLYLLASCWMRVEQEEHLAPRAGDVGDEIGSTIIAGRLVRDLMRLCFLMERCYAPYPKWFGTGFSKLAAAPVLEPIFRSALHADNWKLREVYLVEAYEYVATLHNKLGITAPLPAHGKPFHTRPYRVISMGAFSSAIVKKIADPELKALTARRLIGGLDQFSDSTDLACDVDLRKTLRELYAANSK